MSSSSGLVLLIEDEPALREALSASLELAGIEFEAVADGRQALDWLAVSPRPSLVLTDIQMPGLDGLALLQQIRHRFGALPVILMTAYGTIGSAVSAMREGANDYLTKPFTPQALLQVIRPYLVGGTTERPVVADPKSLQLLSLTERVAVTDATVLVTGPSGTGKEVLARFVHQQSLRSKGPFVAINCAAIPESMLEATLFGYEKGAFTGAVQATAGKFEQAQQGTLFLDEIAELDLGLQAKLLRVLQEREVERLGGRKAIALDIRIVAATNQDLRERVNQGRFREDLYYRLNVFPLAWPALKDRPLDIEPIARLLLARHALRMGRAVPQFTAAAVARLTAYDWPGNVRELDNLIQRCLILCAGSKIGAEDLLLDLQLPTALAALNADVITAGDRSPQNEDLEQTTRQHEFQRILQALRQYSGHRQQVAEHLGISPRTLRYKLAQMREQGIEVPQAA